MLHSRRHLIVSVLCLGSTAGQAMSGDRPGAMLQASRLQALIDDQKTARGLGLRYLGQYPEEGSAEVLTRLTLASFAAQDPNQGMRSLTDNGLRGRLERLVRSEFAARSTVQLDGWLLSRTEARLCALCLY